MVKSALHGKLDKEVEKAFKHIDKALKKDDKKGGSGVIDYLQPKATEKMERSIG